MAAIAGGDVAALEQLYLELRVPVFTAALAITADQGVAEDVLQETFVKVFGSAHLYRPRSKPRAWVLEIARNLAIDALRRRRRERPADEPAGLAPAPGAASGMRMPSETTAALLELDLLERQIVALHVVGGLTHAEIASALRLAPGTVRWKYRVALGRLRERMESSGG